MGLSRISSEILYTQELEPALSKIINQYPEGKVYIATEDNVKNLCLPKFQKIIHQYKLKIISVPEGESNKKIESVSIIWDFLNKNGADRKSLLINIGGGMLTDLAGFAASTFKRGIDFINIPTTLLSQVDASVGGKTGINFNGYKNEIGVFKEPAAVIICTDFLKTVNSENFKSGFAEMIKHSLIHNKVHLDELRQFDFQDIDYKKLQEIIRHSVEIKSYFVKNDPTEKNIRKALNFGHTFGHAFESLSLKQNRPILHGYAVAYGMISELYLSEKICGFDTLELKKLSDWLLSIYGQFNISDQDFDELYSLMTHDKKNEKNRINFTLITETGKFEINKDCKKEIIFEALEFFKNL